MLQTAKIVYFVFAALLIVGGVIGYTSKGSVISLVAGVLCGVLSLVAAMLLARNPTAALAVGLVSALLVAGSFAPRVLKNPNLFPGGVTLALSVVTLAVSVAALLSQRR